MIHKVWVFAEMDLLIPSGQVWSSDTGDDQEGKLGKLMEVLVFTCYVHITDSRSKLHVFRRHIPQVRNIENKNCFILLYGNHGDTE